MNSYCPLFCPDLFLSRYAKYEMKDKTPLCLATRYGGVRLRVTLGGIVRCLACKDDI